MRALRVGFIAFGVLLAASVAWGEAAPAFLIQWGSFGAGSGQFSYPRDVATDVAGNVYVLDTGNNRIQKFTSAGVFVTAWGGAGSGNGQFNLPYGMGTDAAGNVYVAELNNNRIQKFSSAGVYITQWGSPGSGNGQFSQPVDVAVDAAGNVYVADGGNNRIQKFTNTGVYVAQWGSSGSGAGQFSAPRGVATDASGNVFVADYVNNRIQKFTSAGAYITQWGSAGVGQGQFNFPDGLAVDAAGNVYVGDYDTPRVQKFSGTGTFLSQWGSAGSGAGQFSAITGMAASLDGHLYVVDGNHRVQKFGPLYPPPPFLKEWGSAGSAPGEFFQPTDVATDAAGNVFVVDNLNNRIQKFSSDGAFLTQWGGSGSGAGQFNNPWGIGLDASGNVYVGDWSNFRVQKFTNAGAYITQWGSYGSANGQFDGIGDVAVDVTGNVYVTDYWNHRVQKFTSAGAYITQWGGPGTGNGQFDKPQGIAIGADGNVYVAEFGNHRVQKFTSAGAYITKWGSVGSGAGELQGPWGIAIDPSDNVYVGEYYNYRVSMFNGAGAFLTKWNSGETPFNTFVTGVAADASGNVFVVDYNHQVSKFGPSGVTRVKPSRGGDAGPITLVIHGAGFQGAATAKLARSGESDIAGTLVTIAGDGKSLTATFDLTSKLQGLWDVVVTNPGPTALTLVNGFTIEAPAPVQLKVDVIGRALMRPDRRRAFEIAIENSGNNDLLAVPLWVTRIPATATVDADFALAPVPQDGGEPDWSTAPLTLGGPGGKYLAVVIPRVPPGVTVRRIFLTVPLAVGNFRLDASVTPPWADGATFRNCLSSGGGISAPACMGARLTTINAYLTSTPGLEAMNGVGLWAKIAWQCEGSASLPAALVKAEQALDYMLQPVEQTATPAGCQVALSPRWQDSLRVTLVTSVDPNEKLGAGGHGPGRQIGAQETLPYSIRFENQQSATAPVQSLVVTDVLDVSKLELSTLSLGPITFGRRADGRPWTVDPGSGLTSYFTDVDLRPERDLIVRVYASLDAATGVLGWSMTAIDPATGDLPDDPQAGFLPPNVTAPEGEGALFFSVRPKAGLAGGTVIQNRATINFDGAPLLTPYWSNTINNIAPQSAVQPLAGTQDSASFTVRWQASGSPPDLQSYSVYVSENGGAYRPWRVQTKATADTITAPRGGTYAFYSLARDSSGNLEAVPGSPDVQTYSRVAVDPTTLAPQLALEGAIPNPATSLSRVWFTLPSREKAVLEVVDVAGRRVFRRDVGAMGPGRHSADVSAAARRPGLYFLRLTQGGLTLNARMAVIR